MSDDFKELEKVIEPLSREAKAFILEEVQTTYRFPPPMSRETQTGDSTGFSSDGFPNSSWHGYYGELDMTKIEQMMKTGQIAYPMAVKKAPAISIIGSASGFKITSPDERLAEIMYANMREALPIAVDEILTFLEYGAYYGELTWEPIYPQDYGLTKSPVPYWVVSAFHGCHPSTITKILRNEKSKSFEGFVQQVGWRTEPITVDLERALIISNDGAFGRFEGKSVLEPVYVWWFWFELIWRSLLRYLQRVGDGVIIIRAPSRGKVMVRNHSIDAMDWAMQIAASLRKTNQAVMPSDMWRESTNALWGVEFVKTGDEQAGAHFVNALELLSNNIKNYLLTGDVGGKDGDEYTVMLDTERVLGHIAKHLTRYVLRKSLKYNGSKAARMMMEFQGANSRVLPLLFKLMAVAGNTAGPALQNVNWRELFTKGGVPVLGEDEVEQLKKEEEKAQAKLQAAKKPFGQPPEGGKQPFGQGKEEKAKGQPGGEGRWASQQDKEGAAPKLEELEAQTLESLGMIRNAIATPVIALADSQMEVLKDLGLVDTGQPIQLFNPFHDKIGRFSTKALNATYSGFENAKDWVVEHKKQIAIGAGLLAVAGITAIAMSRSGDGNVAAETSGTWNGDIRVRGPASPEEVANIDTAVSSTMGILDQMKVKTECNKVIVHTSNDTFKDAYVSAGGNVKDIPKMNAFSHRDEKVSHLSDEVFTRIRTIRGGDIKKDRNFAQGMAAVAHEMYHMRPGKPLPHLEKVKSPDDLVNELSTFHGIEEGLSEATGTMVSTIAEFGFNFNEQFKNLFEAWFLNSGYSQYTTQLWYIANSIAAKTGVPWNEIFFAWISDGGENTFSEIGQALREAGIQFRLEDYELANPFHDIVGKFTEKEHAQSPLPEGNLKVNGVVNAKTAFRASDAAAVAFERAGYKPTEVILHTKGSDYASSVCGHGNIKCQRAAGRSYAAHVNGKIHVGPHGLSAVNKDRAFGEYMMTHEAFHGRKRSDGSAGVKLEGSPQQKHSRRITEEGLTDILARKASGMKQDSWAKGKTAYLPYMGGLAMLLAEAGGWNREAAWRIADDLQFHINDTEYMNNFLSGVIPGIDWNDVSYYALLVSLQKGAEATNYQALAWMFGG